MKGCGSVVLEELDKREALRYMGFGSSAPDPGTLALLEECEKRLLRVIKPCFVYRCFDIKAGNGGVEVLNTDLLLRGKDIGSHLSGCCKCILLASTLSMQADAVIRQYEAVDMAAAFVADMLASAAVEQVCERAEDRITAELTEFGDLYRTWRFSPGYGDFPLDIQGKFLDILDAPKRIGLCANVNNILIPRKSVTAVIGLSEEKIPRARQGCSICNMRDTCGFRKRGDHCGA